MTSDRTREYVHPAARRTGRRPETAATTSAAPLGGAQTVAREAACAELLAQLLPAFGVGRLEGDDELVLAIGLRAARLRRRADVELEHSRAAEAAIPAIPAQLRKQLEVGRTVTTWNGEVPER